MASPAPEPASPPAGDLVAQGLDHHRAGRLGEAGRLYESALAREPNNADALHLLGLVALAEGRPADARDLIAKALRAAPRSALFRFNLAKAQAALGERRKAVRNLEAALKSEPGWAEAWNSLGTLQAEAGARRKAAHAFRRAVRLRPDYAEAFNNLGLTLAADGRPEDAKAVLEDGRAARPDYPVLLNSLGMVARELGEARESIARLEEAVALAPDYFEAIHNLGVSLADAGRHRDAAARLREALALRPDHAEAWRALAKPLAALGDTGGALAACDRAVALAPDDPRARWERALIRLLDGRFGAGWTDYRARPTADRDRWPLPAAALPHDLTGRRLVLVAEQGLGEQLFFLRFAEPLAARGARLAAAVDARLAPMVGRIPFIGDAVPADRALPAGEPILLGDLPFVAGTGDVAPPPAPIPALAGKRAEIGERLAGAGDGPVLALTWRAGIAGRATLHKVAPMDVLARAVRDWPGPVAALQRAPEAGEIAALAARAGRPVLDLTGLNDDLEAMLALMERVTAYAGVSNTNMHLAAAARAAGAAVRCHVLVPCPAEFRWLARGSESLWFPGFAVHREDPEAGWAGAAETLREALAADRENFRKILATN